MSGETERTYAVLNIDGSFQLMSFLTPADAKRWGEQNEFKGSIVLNIRGKAVTAYTHAGE